MAVSRQLMVCFVARPDFETKPGGDTVQWHMYDQTVRENGMQSIAWFDDRPMPDADVFHAFNIDRPLEIYPKMSTVVRCGKPYILSSIHHPNQWLEKFRMLHPPNGRLGRWLYSSPLGQTVEASESVKEIVRLLRQKRWRHIGTLRPAWSKRVRWLVQHASRVFLLSPRERRFLEEDFGVPLRSNQAAVVPNWVEGASDSSVAPPPLLAEFAEPPVLVVGRVEARKNVVRLCRLAGEVRRPILFLGKPNPNEKSFHQEFLTVLGDNSSARWVPGVPRDELAGYYRHASFLLNASYVEVSPLVDIEALLFGCPVATTQYAVHHEFLPADTPQCDPYDEHQLRGILNWRPARRQPIEVVKPDRCKRELVQLYHQVIEAAARFQY